MKNGKNLTIRDIAEAAGVSAATVSLVLNGKGDISGVTRAKVLEAVASLNYVPRASKSTSEPGETLRFLKIAKHGHTVNRDHSVFISDYIDGMSAEATRRNYTLEVVSFEGQPISSVAESLAGAPISGVVALGTELTEADIRLIQGLGYPTVFIDTFFDVIDANFVDMNNEDAVYKVLSRFHQQGFRRIGFVASHVETTNFKLRRDAFFKNMARLGLSVDPADILSVESTYDGAYSDTRQLLADGLDLAECYFCTNDIIAYGFIRALREHGLTIPDDVSIIGFDNLPQSATMDPGLTTIEVSKRKIGYLAVTILDDLINSTEPQPAVKIQVGADLVLRGSHEKLMQRSKTRAAKQQIPAQ
ncbi:MULTISPECIES: LacI family DNA-binding transcriptional regulator [unclassified Agrobacterium]|uniref:LacI family DNA-binding transcriptional regulator n=1 Tax=unclassified Agrobacterium TaxID=2632611 RepID=UPI00083D4B31|nr:MULTISPECIES: LacI family DNA-binding transcriptional regulator [unclassified Agrobacterium]AOG12741.1 bacterial regulatory s, lacI family protein [Agrobacterium sp. RAC06]MBU0834708.1 LacI family DNA-binding transcriptional regulator [Alphaproteobacteria bacterium]QGG93528.1 LacI family DNA-binding transcriptional regulator [Agrobacterium sp. MA01]